MIKPVSLASSLAQNFTNLQNMPVSTNSLVQSSYNKEQNFVQPAMVNYQSYTNINFNGYSPEFKLPQANKTGFKSFDEVVAKYTPQTKEVIKDFNKRAGQKGQFLNWVDLPKNQLEIQSNGVSHLDEIYSQAATLSSRKNPDGSNRPLVVLGIGGSKHTVEFLLNMNGVGNKGKVLFYSDIDPVSFNNFLKETGKKPSEMNYLVASKSGTTFETADGFKRFENAVIGDYRKKGMNEEQAKSAAQKHFAICTDAKATDKNLRGKIGNKNSLGNNYIKELYIHDDVGGRYSMFDDAGLFALSYAGTKKDIAKRILQSAAKASEKMTNPDDIENNAAAKSAIYNVFSRDKKFKMIQQQYYGKLFQGGGENWAKQLYLESLKDFDYAVGCAPESMHYATEGHFSPNNRTSYNTIMTLMNPNISKNYKTYTGAIAATYNETTPLKIETLEIEGNGIKPEDIGEYIQSKHFETVYTGMLRRENAKRGLFNRIYNKNNKVDLTKAEPEVLQPSVETYKNKFKQGQYRLNPGQ